jgi:hypothetical protein
MINDEMKLHSIEFMSSYIGQLVVDLETKSKDEEEIIEAIKEIEQNAKQDLDIRFDANITITDTDLYLDELSIGDILLAGNDLVTDEGVMISLGNFTTTQSLLYLLAIKSEMMELVKYLHNDSKIIKTHWSLPISESEFSKKSNLETAYSFLRRYD